ncbi:MATE family efflux transporter [Paludibacter sp. 221]|uniref:MATE family efflux transporter n=1 Tax=Paludibacter sp. 221 TaxID=2302939 RepID=UPI0013D67ED9|nr:MATE family efflux transporter [Paludibacter sp. 221]NDV47834.1 MATE family efflux transporter [Paludibacter sp. 221]
MSDSAVISNKLASQKLGKLIWEYSLPAIVGTVVMSLYNIVDRIFIGQGVGAMAISGLALTFPFMNILTAFGMLVGAGAAARISITLGEKDKEKAERILANAFILTFLVSGFAIVLSYIFMGDILRLFGGTDNTVKYAEDYMRIIIPGAILSALSYGFNNIMRASGYPRKAMLTMIICALVNVVLDPIFIFVLDMGIEGAAHATNISYLVGACWVLSHFIKPDTNIRFRRKYFRLRKDIIKSIISIGLSPFSMQVALSFVVVLINIQLIKYGGDLAIGAYGIVNSITTLIVMIIVGLNQGIQPIVGYNYGAKLYDRMFGVLRIAIVVATVVSTIGFLLGMFVPELMVKLFSTDSELVGIAANALRITVVAFPIIGFQIVVSNFFQSIGKAKVSIFLSLTRQFIFLIPALLILPSIFELNGTWAAQPLSDVLATFTSGLTMLIFMKKFKKNFYNNVYR